MSLCQPKRGDTSCGACCGLFNLRLTVDQKQQILHERTIEFRETVDFRVEHSIPAFRQSREKKENDLPKLDPTTYNCPFLGYLNRDQPQGKDVPINKSPVSGRIGCLIHPIATGNPKSQNYSFYGSNICQAYECKNKEKPNADFWEDQFSAVARDSTEYSQLAACHALVRRLEFCLERLPPVSRDKTLRSVLRDFLDHQRNGDSHGLTSFELDYEGNLTLSGVKNWLEERLPKASSSLDGLQI